MERLSIVHLLILSQLTYRFNTVSTKIPVTQFADVGKLILTFPWEAKTGNGWRSDEEERWGRTEHFRSPISSSPWSGRNPVLLWWEHRRTDQRVRTGSPGMEPHKCIQLTSGEGLGQTGKCVVFSVTAGHSPAKRMSQDALYPSQTLIRSSSWA